MRSRNLKPGYFRNELLAECDPLARLLFGGLWLCADRAGRMEYRPKRLKADVLPYDNCDIDELVTQLERRRFVQRYLSDGVTYLAINSFRKHQNPHCKEPPSTIPEPSPQSYAVPMLVPDKTDTSTVQEQDSHSSRTEVARLIPDSLLLIPDSKVARPRDRDAAKNAAPPAAGREQQAPQGQKPNGRTPSMSVDAVIALWHELMPELPHVQKLTHARTAVIHARIREDLHDEESWRDFFAYIRTRPFLMGKEKPSANHPRPFRPSLFWFCKAENYAKCLEGAYQ